MAAATPRQRQYNVAILAQQHNLASNRQTDLLAPVVSNPPDGRGWMALPPRGPVDRVHLLPAWQNDLLTTVLFVPPVPPESRGYQAGWPGARARFRTPPPEAVPNQQNTLYNLTANVPPVGEASLPSRVWGRPPARLDISRQILNALTTTLWVEPPPPPPDYWADIRLGDILPVMLPYAGLSAFCGYVRVMAMVFRDAGGDGLVELEVQWLEPVTITTPLRFISDGGSIPPPIVAQVSQVAEQIVAVTKEQAALGIRMDELEEKNDSAIPKERLQDNVVAAINAAAAASLISGDKIAEIRAVSDPGGTASTVKLTNVDNTGTPRSTGVGQVLFADGTNRDNSGFIKVYIGTTAFYVPVWTAS